MQTLEDIVRDRILILDGAMGTMIQQYALTEEDFRGYRYRKTPGLMKGNNDMLNITRPDVVSDIHRKYLEAGADIITTNTFSSQRISQADYHLEEAAREMAFAGARLARKAADEFATADRPRFVAGSVGPTNKTCSMSPDVSNPAAREIDYLTLYDVYLEQIEALVEGGVDAVLIETVFDTLNAKAAIDATMEAERRSGKRLPIMLSITVSDLAGRTLSGQTLEAVLASVSSYPLFSIGLNCSFGAPQMKPFLKELARKSPYYISAYPNAGLPNSMGEYDETAESMAPQIKEYVIELTIALPCTHCSPAVITSHLDESIITGTFAMSGSEAIILRNVRISSRASSRPSSMFTSITKAPSATCLRAMLTASS